MVQARPARGLCARRDRRGRAIRERDRGTRETRNASRRRSARNTTAAGARRASGPSRLQRISVSMGRHGEPAFSSSSPGCLVLGLTSSCNARPTRRHRRLAWLTAASVAGMAVTSTLAFTAFEARNAAREQRREAEGLVAYMVGDLRAKLEPIGKLDALDGVGSRVLAYYKNQDASELSDAALLQRSRALNLTAEVAYLRGNLAEADGLYKQALAGTAEAVRRSPDDPKRLFDHAQNVFWVGEIARARGQTDQALTAYREYERLADRLVALEPDNLKWRMESLYSAEDVGLRSTTERRFPEAQQQFEGALGPMEKLAAVDPANRTYQKELSTVLAWLADAQRSLGRLDAAIAVRERQIALLDRAVASWRNGRSIPPGAHPGSPGAWKPSDVTGAVAAGHRSISARRLPAPTGSFRSSQEIRIGGRWRSGAQLDLARTLLSLGHRDEAAQQKAGRRAISSRLVRSRWRSSARQQCFTMPPGWRGSQFGAAIRNALAFAEQCSMRARTNTGRCSQ